ncbi:MAG: hypothetical protein AAGB22_08610, partial [Bacteroidota bacterium]
RIDELVPANATLQRTVDLAGYSLDLSGVSGTTVNTLSTNFVVALDSTEDSSFQLSAGDEVSVEATLQGIIPEFAKGYFGQQEVTISESVDNEAFLEILNGGSLDIEDITLRLEIRNAIGADIRARIEELSNRRTSTGTEVALQHSLIDSVVNLNSAVQNPNASPPIDIKNHVFQLTTANSNLDEFLENLGDKIRLDAAVELNPDGNTSGLNDFAYFDEGIAFAIDAELPLQLAGTDLVLVDTADFDFGDEDERVEELDNITGGFVRLVADNGYPFDARVQLLLLDAQNTTIDSLVVGGSVIDAAATDAQGVVTEPVRSVVLAPINQGVLDALYRTDRILIRVAFTTTNQPNRVPIFDRYNIDLKLIGDFTYRVDID